jgi:WD40 repeat protein
MLASVGMDLVVRFWDVMTGQQVHIHNRGNLALGRVRFSPDGKVIGATGNRSLYIWNAASGQRLVSRHLKDVKPEYDWVYWQTSTLYFSPYELSFSAENAKVYTSDASEQVSIWDSQTGKLVNSQKIIPGLKAYFAADGSIFTTSEKRVRHFDLTTASSDTALQTLDAQYPCRIAQLAVSGDSMTVAVSDGQGIQLWDVKAATQKAAFSLADNQFVSNLALNADGTLLAIARTDGGVEIWDMRLQKRIALAGIYGYPKPWSYGDAEFPVPIAFSPDGQLLVAGSSISGQLYFFDVRTGSQLRVMNLHRNGVTDLQFNADGTRLASAGLDGVVFVLEIVDQVTL